MNVFIKDIGCIDVHEEFFLKQNDPLDFFPFRLKDHYNEKGYLAVADLINKNIK